MSEILTEISAGELLDKISILEIKLHKIKDLKLLNEIKKEYEILNKIQFLNFKKSFERAPHNFLMTGKHQRNVYLRLFQEKSKT